MCEGVVYYRLQLNAANSVCPRGECDIEKSNAEEI